MGGILISEFSLWGQSFLTFLTLFCCAFISALSLSGSLWAQEGGSIAGTVTDPSEAVIPGATVRISNGVGLSRDTKTDEAGQYSVAGLPAGTYQVTISQPGFQDFAASAVTVVAGETARVDATLQPAEEVTSVNVAGEKAAQIETETAQLAGTITQKEVTSIGLNGRNFTQLITLAPGVSNQTGQDEALVGIKGSVKYSVNGGRVEYNTFDVDGSDVLNAGINGSQSTLIVFPSLDAISELKVLTSNYGAMYGRSASGTVLVATKSGTSAFHGNAYEFVRNEIWNARNFFDQTHGAPLYRRNDFGGTIGGPFYIPGHYNTQKEKTFFFFSEEVRRELTPQDFNQGVPSLMERSGNFSDVCPFAEPGTAGPGQQVLFKRTAFPDCPAVGPAPDIYGGAASGYFQSFPGNQVPIDPTAAELLSTGNIPAPNNTVGCNSSINSCYDAVVSPPTNWREELFRVDQMVNSKIRATFRYIHDSWNTVNTTPIWPFVQNSFPTIENNFVGPGISMVAAVSHVVSPSFVNNVTLSYTSDHITLTDINGPGGQWQRPPNLNMGYLFNNGFGNKIPGVVISGTNAAYGGFGFAVDPSFEPWQHSNPTTSLRDDATHVVGHHNVQFGVLVVAGERNEIDNASAANTGDVQGLLTFSNVNSLNGTGNAFADFLKGSIRAFQQDSAQYKYYNRYQTAEPYVQDDWHYSPRLTLNLGLRLGIFGRWHPKYDDMYNFVPAAFNSAAALAVNPLAGNLEDPSTLQPIPLDLSNLDPRIYNGLIQCGKHGVPPSCMTVHHGITWLNPAPRVGFAWDPAGDGKTSVRGGYGIFFFHGTGNEANTGSLEGSAPFVLDMTQDNPNGYACIGGVGGMAANCGLPGAGVAYPLNVTGIPTQVVWPYVQQWSFSVQRQLPHSMVATVAYVGSKGTHLTAQLQSNQLQPLDSADNPFSAAEGSTKATCIPSLPACFPARAFVPGEPATSAVCDTWDGGSFTINSQPLTSAQPGFINLEAACFGIKLTGASASKQFPNVNSLRQFAPGLGQIFSLQNIANSRYNAFQATLRRTAGPLNIDLAYTYGQSMDDSSDRFDSTLVNSFNLRSNYAVSNFDQRHLLNVGYVYELPSFAGLGRLFDYLYKSDAQLAQPHATSWLTRQVATGWEFSGLTTFQTGTPFSIINGGSGVNGISVLDNAGVASGTGAGSYPDMAGNPYGHAPPGSNNSKTFGPILGNPNAFAAPQGLTFGDAGRNVMRNPTRVNFDMSLLKTFKIGERVALQLRAEAFNIFNITQFRIYNPERGNTGSNTISCYGGQQNLAGFADPNSGGVNCLLGSSFLHPVDAHRPRTIQFGAKLTF